MKAPARAIRQTFRELTGGFRGLPSVLIIGAQKGGTTSLFNYLVQHPRVVVPFGKEIHYFDFHYHRGPADIGAAFRTPTGCATGA